MAIIYIIGAFQLLSVAVNVLALASFWITPGLRTTANRFVINLLIVNVVGCLALAPALWLPTHNGTEIMFDDSNEFRASLYKLTANLPSSTVAEKSTVSKRIVENGEAFESQTQSDQKTVINRTYYEKATWTPTKRIQYSDCKRFWGFDLVAALGGLSVMLVVGDTWCAITDPLRYHSRVSGLKSYIFICITWLVSIVFCIASALRRDCHRITSEITSTIRKINWRSQVDESPTEPGSPIRLPTLSTNASVRMTGNSFDFNNIYDLCYSCLFFVVIILAPICLVCTMYWKIFSEARQNGLRMRQNGSSPLLQSALNLVTVHTQLTKQAPHERSCSIIGEEESDNIDSLNSSHSNVIHITLRRNSMIADASPTHSDKVHERNVKQSPTKLHVSKYKMNTSNRQRRYLEIPKPNEFHIQTDDPECVKIDEPNTVDKYRGQSVFETSALYCSSKAGTCSELRQAHSTPDLRNGNHISVKFPFQNGNNSAGSLNKHEDIETRLPSICEPSKALSYMTSIRHRLSNASSIFKYREESRAARISLAVIIMFLFSYFPYGLLVMLQGRVTFFANSSRLAVVFLLIANISSPFIFAYRNRRVRRGVCRLFGVDAKTNERLQKQRIIMHGSLRTNSCRERKRKTKIVRINRKLARSSSFSDNARIHFKYPSVLLFDKNSNENEIKREDNAISATNIMTDHKNYHVPTNQLSTDFQTTDMHLHEKNNHYENSNFTMRCDVYDISSKNSNKTIETKQSIYVKDFANGVFIEKQNRGCINSSEECCKTNINRTNSNGCNLSATIGASVIKKKISLLRCVHMNTVRKHSVPNSPTCVSSSFFDNQLVNV